MSGLGTRAGLSFLAAAALSSALLFPDRQGCGGCTPRPFPSRRHSRGTRGGELRDIVQRASASRVRELAREHVAEIDQSIRELQNLKGQLEGLLRRKSAVTAGSPHVRFDRKLSPISVPVRVAALTPAPQRQTA